MALSDLEWTTRLTARVAQAIPEVFGEGAGLASSRPERIDRRYSFMFRYHIKMQRGMKKILVKIPHESWMQSMDEAIMSEHIREVVSKEFNVLASIADMIESSESPRLFAIRPLACFPELGALLTEEHPLQMLKKDLAKVQIALGTKDAWMKFREQVELAGIWLSTIHKDTYRGHTQSLDSLDIPRNLDKEIDYLEKLSGNSLTQVRSKFQALCHSLQKHTVPFAALHNDYHLGNIFVLEDGRVGALDPNWVECGSIYEDISSLLIDPLTRKMQVLLLGLTFRPHLYTRFETAVLRGYYGDSDIPFSLIYFYCALGVIEKWRMDEDLLRKKGLIQGFFALLGAPLIRYYFNKLTLMYLNWGLERLGSNEG